MVFGQMPAFARNRIASRANRMHFVVSQSGRVRECLADVFFLEVWQVRDDLCRCHPVRNKIDDVGDGDAKSADRRASRPRSTNQT